MFVLISMPPKMDPRAHASIIDLLNPSRDECVLGVFATKDLAVQGISAYTGTPHAGKTAVIYEMVPSGDKQKRVKIYEGSFPLFAVKLTSDIHESSSRVSSTLNKILNKRVQKLEEKLEAKVAECNNLRNDASPKINNLSSRLQKLEEKLESKCAECNLLKADNDEMSALITRMRDMIQV
jgi:tetrahydromethanopterin S-methyltransferase subunit G